MDTARTFESIVIVFNPNSTCDTPKLAEQLHERLGELLSYTPEIRLQPTCHAGPLRV